MYFKPLLAESFPPTESSMESSFITVEFSGEDRGEGEVREPTVLRTLLFLGSLITAETRLNKVEWKDFKTLLWWWYLVILILFIEKTIIMESGLPSWHVIEMECSVGSISLEKFHIIGKVPGQWDSCLGLYNVGWLGLRTLRRGTCSWKGAW